MVARRRRWPHVVVLLATYAVAVSSAPAVVPPTNLAGAIYLDPTYSPPERAADLVARMTLAEKAQQLVSSQAPAIPRLRVRAYGWWNEAIHGVARESTLDGENPPELINTTVYPVSLSLGSTWDPDLMYRVAQAISDEAREVVRDNTLDLNFYSPTVNLARDPRWGRNDETYSEDPFLTAAIAAQYVNGMEGKDPTGRPLAEGGGYLKTTTTLKHYAANNSEFNRRTGSSDMDERTLREYYTAQFRSIIRQSDPASIMTGYNAVNGVPASASVHLLETLGRQTFGFTGFYTSDCDSVSEIEHGHHWVPPGHDGPVDTVERGAFANAAGVDLKCQLGYHDGSSYADTLPQAARRRVPTEAGPYTEFNLDASLVRLFTARIRLGEFDDPARVPWVIRARAAVPAGTWTNADTNRAVTQTPSRLALARAAGAASIVLLRNEAAGGRPLLPLRIPASGPFRVAVLGPAARPESMFLGGYSSDQRSSGIANQVNGYDGLRAAITAVNPAATVDFLPGVPSISTGPVDDAAVAAAAAYDLAVVYAGTERATAAEDTDRADLALPGAQAELIRRVAAANPRTVVYLETIGQVDLGGIGAAPALLWSSYNGQRKGEALADVLLGTVNPSARLPFTWYADAGALPPIGDYAIRPSATSAGRTYLYFTGDVAYPFGHGRSYTTFGYSDPRTESATVDAGGMIRLSVDVTNTGPVAGAQVVQLYAATPDAPPARQRPTERLVAFRRVSLAPGQTSTVELAVPVRDLAFFDQATQRFALDPGRYELRLATSSRDIQARRVVTVTGTLPETPATLTARPRVTGDRVPGPRVIFPTHAVIDPRLTVTLADDSVHGPDQPLPSGSTVRFSSNRPSVVAVGGDDEIRTVAPGVAMITTTLTHQGASVSTTFVVLVR
jgi:beta-glucosidase